MNASKGQETPFRERKTWAHPLLMQQALHLFFFGTYLRSVLRRPCLTIGCELQEVAPVANKAERRGGEKNENNVACAPWSASQGALGALLKPRSVKSSADGVRSVGIFFF